MGQQVVALGRKTHTEQLARNRSGGVGHSRQNVRVFDKPQLWRLARAVFLDFLIGRSRRAPIGHGGRRNEDLGGAHLLLHRVQHLPGRTHVHT